MTEMIQRPRNEGELFQDVMLDAVSFIMAESVAFAFLSETSVALTEALTIRRRRPGDLRSGTCGASAEGKNTGM